VTILDTPAAPGDRAQAVLDRLATVVLGQEDVLRQMMVALLAGGHALMEGVPGTAKTLSIRSLALAGTKLYVAHYQDGLRVLDVSNPSEPREVGYFNTWRETDKDRGQSFFEGISDVAVPGDGYIYAAETSRGLVILREQP